MFIDLLLCKLLSYMLLKSLSFIPNKFYILVIDVIDEHPNVKINVKREK